ncbi:YraN family protein [Christiangramia echinicola]|uniref:YraN family protein n=1 Tax=Christiangramia echinicola TaxID=279359 RepID=UPI000408CEC3|nr:YraN family protein [Christiangramia echinicola]
MADHNELGRKGEVMAVEYLRLKEYEILELNYRYQKAEVDIIARRGNLLIAAEVKTRSTPEFGNPQDFVKPKQIQQLVKAVNHYVEESGLDLEVRFDIIAIIKNKSGTRIEHIQDAFLYF